MLTVVEAAMQAGTKIMEIYKTDFDVEYKEDKSPLTIADQSAHQLIKAKLKHNFPDIPILSEEGEHLSYKQRSAWKKFWLVDPLDGTKEFIKKNDEFTVNIALVEDGKPVFGVIYAPALDVLYIGDKKKGAVKIERAEEKKQGWKDLDSCFQQGTALPLQNADGEKVRVVASRSHMSKETEQFIEKLKKTHDQVDTVSSGSSLKLCLVAEGTADYYPRFAPTMEWDTGAGQAIVEATGGTVTVADDDKGPLVYNKENLKNPWFLAQR